MIAQEARKILLNQNDSKEITIINNLYTTPLAFGEFLFLLCDSYYDRIW